MSVRCKTMLGLVALLLGAPLILSAEPPPKPEAGQAAEKPAGSADRNEAEEVLCPVTGRKVDFNLSTRFRGKLVYFADAAALEKFTSDADPYLEGVKAQWKALRPRRLQVLCPVTGKACDEQYSLPYGHGEVRFASQEALERWKADPKPHESKLEECYTFQTHCLVCGHEIQPNLFVEVQGRRLYTACGGCIEVIEGNPGKYLKKADEMIAANRAFWEKSHGPRKASKP